MFGECLTHGLVAANVHCGAFGHGTHAYASANGEPGCLIYRDVPITRYRVLNRYALAAKPIQDMAVPITAATPPSSGTTTGKKASAAAAKSEEDSSEFEKKLIDDRSAGGKRVAVTPYNIEPSLHHPHTAALPIYTIYR